MSKIAISVRNLGKKYRLGATLSPDTLRDHIMHVAGRLLGRGNSEMPRSRKEDFWALKDVSFDVQQGDVLGVIGPNGAGKSTLLKILTGITEPTEGEIRLKGRVASLLEVGTGFHQELSGRENIYMNGAILGMTRAEINAKFDEIVAFAGIEKFLDTPVKRYSSGMRVRLGFAVAAHLEPEILLIDEVLAVGDASFQKKCLGKIDEIAKGGRTVLFVSHNMVAVQNLCGRGIWLNDGKIIEEGQTDQVVSSYLKTSLSTSMTEQVWDDIATAPGNEIVHFHRVGILQERENESGIITMATPFEIEIEYWHLKPDKSIFVDLVVYNEDGSPAFESYSTDKRRVCAHPLHAGLFRSVCYIPGDLLNEGTYRIRIQFVDDSSAPIINLNNALRVTIHDVDSRQIAWYGRCYGPVHPKLCWKTEFLAPLSGRVEK